MSGPAASDDAFYARLAPCESFAAVGDISRFRPLPADWLLTIGDIRDSTPAIAAGRYKDVNMVGAACIVAALNAAPGFDLPFVFGGDGATLAIPRAALAPVREALLRTRALAAANFALDLRVGIVPVAELRARGADVLAAKLAVSPGNHLAMLAGGGVELAERLIKQDEGFAVTAPAAGDPDLEGLSCRWEPLASTRGRMASLLVRGRAGSAAANAAIYRRVVDLLAEALDADPLAGQPIRPENLRLRWPPRGLGLEAALSREGARARRLLRLGLQSLAQVLLDRFGLSAGGYDAPAYRRELRANTDYRRFDGTLRLVFDCTAGELAAVEAALERLRAAGELYYGLHVADSALMTCLVFDLAQGRHLHFLDGADGGFALAAAGLKAQLAQAAEAALQSR